MYYKRLTCGLKDKGELQPANWQSKDFLIKREKDYYLSIYDYNEDHLTQFEKSGSVKGIEDVTTEQLLWDFDNEEDLEIARRDAVELCGRLEDRGIDPDDIQIYFSGNKGFHVVIDINERIDVATFKAITYSLASDLESYDKSISDPPRVIRVVNTKHQTSGLYKTAISSHALQNWAIPEITLFSSILQESPLYGVVNLPDSLLNLKKEVTLNKLEDKEFSVDNIDFSKKVKGWPNCKWAILNGYQVQAGNRHEKLTCVVAQSKALNCTQEQAYYNAKLADEYGQQNYGGEKSQKEDIWTIVESVYDDSWKGGTFTCKNNKTVWLAEICQSLGPYKCKHSEIENLVDVEKVFTDFFGYAKNIEKNTIKTGISDIDDNMRITIGQMVGILGAPSSGKTALALELLENTSRSGLLSVFYSLDMAKSELFQKIAQRVTGLSDNKLFDIFKNDQKKAEEIGAQVAAAYKNVKFCFDTGISVEKIDAAIEEFEDSNPGKKMTLLLLDYNELLSSPFSDMTASSGHNAGAMKKLTNKREICTISLLQPPKMVGDASCEVNSYRNIKGSSLLEQCFSIVIGIYRPGFSAENNSKDDVYMVMNVLKNRLGKLFNKQFYWNGLTGKIKPIDEQGKRNIKALKEKKQQEKDDLQLS